MCINLYTYQQRLAYAKRIQQLQQAVVIKDNIHLTYKYKNQNKAIANAHSLQDKIIKSIVDNAVSGNADSIKNIDSQVEKLLTTTLENERKRIHNKKDHYIDNAVEQNSAKYSKILTNRINQEAFKLESKIESEIRSGIHKKLTEAETRQELLNKYGDTGKARIKNIIRDSIHTNESNISFIDALSKGYNYKVWMNGRGKGKTRPWHKANIITSVPIEEYFDIYGSYHAQLMYPGDLYGGAENVANCRCWLRYTNKIPGNLKKKIAFNSRTSSQLNKYNKSMNKVKTKIQGMTHNIKSKFSKVKDNIKDKFNLYNKAPQLLKPKRNEKKVSIIKEKLYKNKYGKKSKIIPYKDIVIVQQEHAFYVDIQTVKRGYDKLPKSIKKYVKRIVINEKYLGDGDIQGAVQFLNSSVIELYPTLYADKFFYEEVIWHEAGHVYDNRHIRLFSVSKSLKWWRAVRADKKYINKHNFISHDGFVSKYAKNYYNENKLLLYKRYSEDFADSVRMYISKDPNLQMLFPNRYKLLKKVLGDVNNV